MAVTMKKLHTAADAVRKVCGQADIAVIEDMRRSLRNAVDAVRGEFGTCR